MRLLVVASTSSEMLTCTWQYCMPTHCMPTHIRLRRYTIARERVEARLRAIAFGRGDDDLEDGREVVEEEGYVACAAHCTCTLHARTPHL